MPFLFFATKGSRVFQTPWAEVVANEAIRKRGAPTCGSGLAGEEWSPTDLTLGQHRVYTENIDLPQESWLRKAKPRTPQEFLLKSQPGALRRCVESGRPQCTTSSHDAAGPANGGASSTPAVHCPRERLKVFSGYF